MAHGAPDTVRLRQLTREPLYDVVLLDADSTEQRTIAEAADHWIGVASLWHRPDPWGVLAEETTSANGRPLTFGWDGRWLKVMRANQWMVRWRLAPGDFEGMFAPLPSARCAGIVLLGAREQACARAQDYLSGIQTVLPVPAPAVPYIPDDDAREQQTISAGSSGRMKERLPAKT